jgi:hypothetical protein
MWTEEFMFVCGCDSGTLLRGHGKWVEIMEESWLEFHMNQGLKLTF